MVQIPIMDIFSVTLLPALVQLTIIGGEGSIESHVRMPDHGAFKFFKVVGGKHTRNLIESKLSGLLW